MTPQTIRETRQRLGLSQGQAARLFGVDGRSWRRFEHGDIEPREPILRLLMMADTVPGVLRALQRLAERQ